MKYNYNWSMYPEIKEFLNKIYNNSLPNVLIHGYDMKFFKELLSYIEDYLFYLIDNGYNIENVINKLNKISDINFFDLPFTKVDDEFTIMPVKIIDDEILLNNMVIGNERLYISERRRLNLYVGLSHFLILSDKKEINEFSKIYNEILDKNDKQTEYLVNEGWKLLEDGLSQELGERITYSVLNRKRPGSRPGLELLDPYPIYGSMVESNLEMYRMYSSILPVFGITVGGIATYMDYSEETIMNNLLKEAINKVLSSTIINEYIASGNEFGLYQILYLFGLLVNEKENQFTKTIVPTRLAEEDTKRIMSKLANLFSAFVNLSGKSYRNNNEYVINKNIFVKKRLKDFIEDNNI